MLFGLIPICTPSSSTRCGPPSPPIFLLHHTDVATTPLVIFVASTRALIIYSSDNNPFVMASSKPRQPKRQKRTENCVISLTGHLAISFIYNSTTLGSSCLQNRKRYLTLWTVGYSLCQLPTPSSPDIALLSMFYYTLVRATKNKISALVSLRKVKGTTRLPVPGSIQQAPNCCYALCYRISGTWLTFAFVECFYPILKAAGSIEQEVAVTAVLECVPSVWDTQYNAGLGDVIQYIIHLGDRQHCFLWF